MSGDAPDTGSDLEKILNVNCVAEEPGEYGATATSQPETTGEVGPTGSGEKVRRGKFDCGVSGRDMGLFPGLVVQQEQQAQDVNGTDGSKQSSCLLVLGCAQRAADGERPVQQVAEGSPRFQTSEIW